MKKKIIDSIPIILMVIGFALVFWGAIKIDNYPGFKEMRKEAFHSVHVQYISGLVILIIGWILSVIYKFR